jgi:HNH endonuclease/AP2 domain
VITLERLREVLEYNPESGVWVWKVANSRRAPAGKIAGSLDNNGYVVIRIDRAIYKAHRLAWLYMIGSWPRSTIDHINLEPADNRWVNLREATHSQNNANTRRCGASGIKGVYPHRGRWRVNFRNKYVGIFDTQEQAREAYLSAARSAFGEFARG